MVRESEGPGGRAGGGKKKERKETEMHVHMHASHYSIMRRVSTCSERLACIIDGPGCALHCVTDGRTDGPGRLTHSPGETWWASAVELGFFLVAVDARGRLACPQKRCIQGPDGLWIPVCLERTPVALASALKRPPRPL